MREREGSRPPPKLDSDTFDRPISELFSDRPLLCVEADKTLGDAIAVMQENRIGAVVVTDKGRMVGILTERDFLMKVLGRVESYLKMRVSEVMTPNPESLRADDTLAFLMNKMHVGGFRHVPVVNDAEEPTHMVSVRDVLAFILGHFHADIHNLPPDPQRGATERDGG